jgi:hypothetical protein
MNERMVPPGSGAVLLTPQLVTTPADFGRSFLVPEVGSNGC